MHTLGTCHTHKLCALHPMFPLAFRAQFSVATKHCHTFIGLSEPQHGCTPLNRRYLPVIPLAMPGPAPDPAPSLGLRSPPAPAAAPPVQRPSSRAASAAAAPTPCRWAGRATGGGGTSPCAGRAPRSTRPQGSSAPPARTARCARRGSQCAGAFESPFRHFGAHAPTEPAVCTTLHNPGKAVLSAPIGQSIHSTSMQQKACARQAHSHVRPVRTLLLVPYNQSLQQPRTDLLSYSRADRPYPQKKL